MTTASETVEPGQIWVDNDKRSSGRKVRITEVSETHAWADDGKRRTRIRLDRFRPTSTGYRLVRNADGTPAAPGGAR